MITGMKDGHEDVDFCGVTFRVQPYLLPYLPLYALAVVVVYSLRAVISNDIRFVDLCVR